MDHYLKWVLLMLAWRASRQDCAPLAALDQAGCAGVASAEGCCCARGPSNASAAALRAQMEETDVRIAEIKKDAYEFKRDIVTGAENFRTGKIVAEKAVRYMEDKLRAKAAVAEKLRLKNATLKQQYPKVEASLQQKEDMGEVLHVIDFDQLKIENQQYLEKIEERNNELLRLKLTTGNTV